MRIFTLLFLLGICSVQFFSHLPSLLYGTLLIVPLILCYLLPSPYHKIGHCSFALLLGFFWILCQAQWLLSLHLPQNNNSELTVIGTISSIPEQHNHAIIFNFAATRIDQIIYSELHPLQLRITWFGHQPEHVRVGDKWQLHIRLAKPHSYVNPGSFNYQKWLFENHINALGTVQNRDNNLLLHVNRWLHPVDRIRQLIDEKLQWYLYGLPLAGLITALCVGIRDQINPQQWQVLRNTGTNHLMAIAGLHISCIASMAYFIVNFFWRRISRFTLNFPVQQAAALISLMSAIIYSAMAGFALPTQRAVLMLAVFLLTTLLRRHISAWTAWSLAL